MSELPTIIDPKGVTEASPSYDWEDMARDMPGWPVDLQTHARNLQASRGTESVMPVSLPGSTQTPPAEELRQANTANGERTVAQAEGMLWTGQHLRNIVELELHQGPLPRTARLAREGEEPNLRISRIESSDSIDVTDPANLPYLQEQYVQHCTYQAVFDAWWPALEKLSQGQPAETTRLIAKHVLEAHDEGKPLGQKYEIFEAGAPVAPEDLQTVYDVLQLIDQFSGGRLVSEGPVRIVLTPGLFHREYRPDIGYVSSEVAGINRTEFSAISISAAEERAKKYNMDKQELIAHTLIHEVLGHALERAVENGTGIYLADHFEYSGERLAQAEKATYTAYEAITAKDTAYDDSRPVAEYGWANAAEDLATSIDSAVSAAMGWPERAIGPQANRLTADTYRHDLSIALMQKAAEMTEGAAGTPGFVGSKVNYVAQPEGKTVARPSRTFTLKSFNGEAAAALELQQLVQGYKAVRELIIEERVIPVNDQYLI